MLTSLLLACALLGAPSSFVVSLPEYDRLEARQREVFDDVATEEFCGCDSGLPLLRCLKEKPKCKVAGPLGKVLARASATGVPRSAVSMFMSQSVVGPFCANAQNVAMPNAPRQGAADAPLQVVEFFDYRCTHCRAAMPLVHAGIASAGPRAALTLVPVALIENSPSQVAGEAALAAAAQGKFWPMHKALFDAGDASFTPEGVKAIAKSVGLNMARFDKAMQTHAQAAQLKEHRTHFLGLGLDGTPALFVNGRRFELEPKAIDLVDRLAMEQARGGAGCE